MIIISIIFNKEDDIFGKIDISLNKNVTDSFSNPLKKKTCM